MTPQEESNLAKLLKSFDATCLGQGNAIAGANLLATMAVTIANLSRKGSCIKMPKFGEMGLGVDLLINGGLSTGLVRDNVIKKAATCQNNLVLQLRQLLYNMNDQHKRFSESSAVIANTSRLERALLILLDGTNVGADGITTMWNDILQTPHNQRLNSIALNPKFLVTAKSPKDLGSQLKELHNNRPLVVLGLNSPENVDELADTCVPLMDGFYPSGDRGETVLANLLVCDPANVLAMIAPNSSPRASWLNRLVWLVDSDIGPLLQEDSEFLIYPMTKIIENTLAFSVGKRMNHLHECVTIHEIAMDSNQLAWIQFLKSMEIRFPGISGIARNLLTTLAFGLAEMNPGINGKDSKLVPDEIEAFGKWIIYRMVNARAAKVGDAKRERSLIHAKKILETLGNKGSLSTREIYRSRTLDATIVKELLLSMERAGLLRRTGDKWECLENGDISKLEIDTLLIDV